MSDSKKYHDINMQEYVGNQLAPEDNYILLPSRVTRQKGIIEAVKALAIVNQKQPVKLLLTGMAKPFDETYAQQIRDQARRLGIASKVISPKKVIPRHHLPFFFKKARIVALPSYYEGLGLAAIEAHALGIPLIASDTVGLNEIVLNGTSGLTVKPGSHQELAAAIIRLLEDRVLAKSLVDGGLKNIQKFNIQKHMDFIEQTYKKLIISGRNTG